MSDTPEAPKPLLDADTYTATAATDPRVTHRAVTQEQEKVIDVVDERRSPVNVDVPYVTQEGATLSCTMGNWQGEPTAYAYQWWIDGVDAGNDLAITATEDDVGKSATCVVTASNEYGSTDAPASNALVIVEVA